MSHQNNLALLAPIQIRGPPPEPCFGQFETPSPCWVPVLVNLLCWRTCTGIWEQHSDSWALLWSIYCVFDAAMTFASNITPNSPVEPSSRCLGVRKSPLWTVLIQVDCSWWDKYLPLWSLYRAPIVIRLGNILFLGNKYSNIKLFWVDLEFRFEV